VPEGWSWARLNQIFNFIDYRGSTPTKISSGVPLITAKNVKSGYIDYTVDDYISEDEYADRQQRGISCYGDILFTTEAPLGNAAIADLDKFSAGQRLITFQHYGNQKLNNTNFLYFLLSDFFQNQLNANKTGSTVAGIKAAILKGLFLPVPPIEEQQRIAASCKNMFNMIEIVKNEQEDISKLISITKSKILDLAIRGKLVPQDPNDEPASVLLDRIQSEKEELIKAGKIKRDKKESVIFKGEDNSYYQQTGTLIENINDWNLDDIPINWELCCLGEICDYGNCVNVDTKDIDEEAWVLDLEDIEKDSGKVIHKIRKYERDSSSTKHLFKKGQVLYSKLRPYLNKVVLADEEGFCTSEILPLNFSNVVEPQYALYYLMSPTFLKYANRCSYGVKMPRLGTADGRKAVFPLPPFEEQRRISQHISKIFIEIDDISNMLL
jgi:type I restriction enzyme S subunit